MNWLKNIKIGKKLFIIFFAVALLSGILGIFSYIAIQNNNIILACIYTAIGILIIIFLGLAVYSNLKKTVFKMTKDAEMLSDVQINIQDLISDIKILSDAVAAGNLDIRADLNKHKGSFKTILQEFYTMMSALEAKTYDYENILDSIPYYLIVTDLKDKIKFMNRSSIELFGGHIADRKLIVGSDYTEWNNDYQTFIDMGLEKEYAKSLSEKEFQNEEYGLCNIQGEKYGRVRLVQDVTEKVQAAAYIKDEIGKVASNLMLLKEGNLHLEFNVGEGDANTVQEKEIFEAINSNLKEAVGSIGKYINELSFILEKFAEGDLTTGIKSEFCGDFIVIKNSVNKIMNTMNTLLGEINTAAEEVANGSIQVSAGNQTIAQGATEQASSIEELTVTISHIAEQTKQNVEISKESKKMAMESMTMAQEGNEHMKKMLHSMHDINQSSENISKIIKVIDDLASRTNILSLNASVEAARAGVHGKGFAVVAEEVRNLALQSAQAAKDTAELIEVSVKKVEIGTEIADKTAQALAEIVQGTSRAVELEEKIAAASEEQAQSIVQVNLGIQQMSQVVQTNSAIAQESAAASQELNGQAEMLKGKAGMFKLKK